MGVGSWWVEFRLNRLERKLKALHVRQRHARDKLHELEREHRRGKLASSEFEERAGKLRAEKHELTERVSALNAEVAALRHDLKGTAA